ncbi:ubiquinol-cytochrome c reductase cytochrome c1 [Neoasaia chiangmaiensis NBRC 101099]|uniref:Cytochrome c1 n=1 Tax=Neoasaia chiangmaiensis TaxID=320497 RepID=A0A1U9KM49_9PROT|nr:cytochrome c1 [Neoasaia chiangmaiensis]AQS86871.1 ubiquinol-cytochrome C reductase [Neoasaia chiangmaiensis]GBR37439.1 ubiquinol-cytochrome c reductase cytochrome c1 [Neoasaia chiangmaiensis NBRC 101099]GEN14953.1 ubiquinol cytochrome C oxidoreductase [Neoasaia chiangmaiensis]
MKTIVSALFLAASLGAAHADTAAQRGFIVYRQVCGTCHSLKQVRYADLADLGLPVGDIKAYAAQHQVPDGVDEDGDPKTRPATPEDTIDSPYPNDAMARLANHGDIPPDFSRRALTQRGGSAWIAHMLQSYASVPPDLKLPAGSFYNTAMSHKHIGMPSPWHPGQVTYRDGTPASVPRMAQDIAAFLDWIARPHLATRHRVGVAVLVYLAIMTGLMFALKTRVWRRRKF